MELPIFLVGGAVRDLLMGRSIMDLDLVVEGDANRLAVTLADRLDGEVVARSQFGTAKLRLAGQRIDLVTARRETYSRPGALPTVRPGTIADDLERRDFAINALALRLAPEPVHLLDPKNGRGDIAAGLVRVLHSASFRDDATRILRAVRYEQRLGFRLEQETETLVRYDLPMLDTISGDRLRRELNHIFCEEHAARILVRAANLDVLSALYSSLPDAAMLGSRLSRLVALDGPVQPLHYLAVMAYSMTSGQRAGFMGRLNMPATWARVVEEVALAREAANDLAEETSPVAIYRRLNPLSLEGVQIAGALALDDDAQYNVQRYLRKWRHVRPVLKGRDLARLGVPPGPQVGSLLEDLREARLQERIRTRQEEEAFVKEWASSP